ncbi:MAG: ABC transporter ATP-binding protein [Gammaproteobacteria bacterium]|nr:ABC transporter ATP-binding protein [Gammaproteobacteria bacterium]
MSEAISSAPNVQQRTESVQKSDTKSREQQRNYSAFDQELTHAALNLRMLMRLLQWAKPYKLTLITSSILVTLVAGLSVLMPIVQSRVVIDTVLVPNHAPSAFPDFRVVDAFEWVRDATEWHPLLIAMSMYLLMFVITNLMSIAQQLTLTSGALKTLRDLRVDLFTSLEHKPASFYDNVGVGRVMTRITNDVENLFNLITSFVQHTGDFVPFIFVVVILFHMDIELTFVGMAIIPIAAAATILFRWVMREIFRLIRDSVSQLNQYMQEDLMGIEVVQLSGREEYNISEYRKLNQENRRQEFRAINWEVAFESFNTSLTSFASAAVLWYGGGKVVQEEISLGMLYLFLEFLNRMVAPIMGLGYFFNVLFRSMASGERIFQALDWDERIHEPEHPVKLPERLKGKVEFRNVSFAYPGSEQVLSNVSFAIEPGEKLAIVGATGSGKSTIIRLLARSYDFEDNMIFVDDIDVNQIQTNDLRRRVGVVLQDFHIFSGTILDNIALSNPNVSRERAIWASRLVNAHRFIEELSDGYDTELAERGHNLSQGQQQLLAFARVLASDTEILVLDEATSSIDTGTELLIQEALHNLTIGRTCIIIAHRLQTIQECDRILVLHQGQVRELGTHEELLAKKGIYYTLHELQFQDSATATQLTTNPDEAEANRRRRWVEMNPDDSSSPFGGEQGGGGFLGGGPSGPGPRPTGV